jgi:hypothetical protein
MLVGMGLLEAMSDPLGGNRRQLRLTPAGEQLVTSWGAELERRLAGLLDAADVPYRSYPEQTRRLLAALDPIRWPAIGQSPREAGHDGHLRRQPRDRHLR